MTKKQLYIVIVFLCIGLAYVLLVPAQQQDKKTIEQVKDTPSTEQTKEEVSVDQKEAVVVTENTDVDEEVVILEGIFIGFVDGEDVYKKKFKYMLLNDGVEVLRIDLRPLIGYSDLNVIDKLGVQRGDTVTVTGMMNEGKFKIQSVQ